MKKFILTLLLPALSLSATAQEPFQIEAFISKTDGSNLRVYILAATKTAIRYKTTKVSTDFTDEKITDLATIFVVEPAEYSEAIDLFEGRKYKEAKEKFAELKETYKPISSLKDNFSTLSAFHELECLRKLGDYEGLAAALKSFIKGPLTRDNQLRQLDLYIMWDAVRALAWDRVLLIASERDDEVLPGYQRAQVAYCKGLALENLERGQEAIIEYDIAMTADSGASEVITKQAALGALRIYFKDNEVQVAIQNWGTEDENRNSTGFTRLAEAAALAVLYEKFFGLGEALPGELKDLKKYVVEPK
jgi:tetratricopeptide (TPR) repeat protein